MSAKTAGVSRAQPSMDAVHPISLKIAQRECAADMMHCPGATNTSGAYCPWIPALVRSDQEVLTHSAGTGRPLVQALALRRTRDTPHLSAYGPSPAMTRSAQLLTHRRRPLHTFETCEIAIEAQNSCAVLDCQRGKMRVRCHIGGGTGGLEQSPEYRVVLLASMNHLGPRMPEPALDTLQRVWKQDVRLEVLTSLHWRELSVEL